MKVETYYCDRCKCTIHDIVFQLSCTATAIDHAPLGVVQEAAAQNIRQSMARQLSEKHLCRDCRHALTDGIFIV